jgi:lipopolysaccharide biosynthesis regulator YciM
MNAWWDLSQQISTPLPLILAGILLCLALLLIVWRRRQVGASRGHRRRANALSSALFERGFDLLLDNRWQEAADVLKDAVKRDPGQTSEYFELAKLLRRQGEPTRSARMFEQLLARPDLDRAVRIAAQYELALAYRVLGWHEFAVARLEQVLGLDPSHAAARRELRGLYEELGRWQAAVAVEMLRLKRGEAQDRRTLAALLTQQGKVSWVAGHLRDSAAHLQSALKLDPEASEAALCLGRLLLQQGKLQQAFQVWDGLAKTRPEFLFLAFRDLQAAYRQLANETGWESFLRAFTERHPNDPAGYLALAEWYEARDHSAEALPCLRQVLELDPLCREAQLALLSLYRTQGLPSEVLDSYERLVRATVVSPAGRFRCRTCGHTAAEPFWKCPGCRTWAAPERLIPPPSAMPIMAGDTAPRPSHANLAAAAPIVVTRDTLGPPAPGA